MNYYFDIDSLFKHMLMAITAIGTFGGFFYLAGFMWATGVIRANQYANKIAGQLVEQGRNIERIEQAKREQGGGE